MRRASISRPCNGLEAIAYLDEQNRELSGKQVIEVGVPENLTLNQVVEVFERASGHQAKKRHVPLPIMRAMSILMQPVNPALNRLIRLGIFMDTVNLCFDMTETARAFGIQLTPLEEVARRATTSAGLA